MRKAEKRLAGRVVLSLDRITLRGSEQPLEFNRVSVVRRTDLDRHTLVGIGHRIGMSERRLARALGISKTRVHQILELIEGRARRPEDDGEGAA